MSDSTKGARRRGTYSIGTLCLAGTLTLAACGFNPNVRSMASPDARFNGRTTFRVMDLPTATTNGNGDGGAMSQYDPMRENSISALAIRDQLRKTFEAKGYRYADTNPDLEIAYYATVRPVLDLGAYNYGYDYGWYGLPRTYALMADLEDDEGIVVVDVIDPGTKKLLWRGQSTAVVSHNPDKYTKQLRKSVNAIQKKYPPPTP